MIDVRLFATLPMHSAKGRKEFQLEAVPGLTVRSVVLGEGLAENEVHIVMINGQHGNLDSELHEGDRVGLFPPVGGG